MNAPQQEDPSPHVTAQPAPGNPFHLAIPVHDMRAGCLRRCERKSSSSSSSTISIPAFTYILDKCCSRSFYGEVLGLEEGRRSEDKWQDYSLFGHQLVCHFVGEGYRCQDYYNPVDGDEVPVPHFGCVLTVDQFHALQQRLEMHNVRFIVQPHLRFVGQPGEQWTMFFKDPSNNNLEFKAMTNPNNLFAKYNVV